MQTIITKYKLLPLLSTFILFVGCSTKETIAVSEVHLYNDNYGVVSDSQADKLIAQEIEAQNEPTQVDCSNCDPKYTTELKHDPDAFLAKDWVQPKPKISYKYMDDPNFYTEDELPKNKFKTGNTIIKLPKNSDKSLLYSQN